LSWCEWEANALREKKLNRNGSAADMSEHSIERGQVTGGLTLLVCSSFLPL